jgi:hypothetical protein
MGDSPHLVNLISGYRDSVRDSQISWVPALIVLSLAYYVFSIVSLRRLGPKVPLVGTKSLLDTRFLTNWRFFRNGASVVNEGYNKVSQCYTNSRPHMQIELTRFSTKELPTDLPGMMRTLLCFHRRAWRSFVCYLSRWLIRPLHMYTIF